MELRLDGVDSLVAHLDAGFGHDELRDVTLLGQDDWKFGFIGCVGLLHTKMTGRRIEKREELVFGMVFPFDWSLTSLVKAAC